MFPLDSEIKITWVLHILLIPKQYFNGSVQTFKI